jgi:hypothetical protein
MSLLYRVPESKGLPTDPKPLQEPSGGLWSSTVDLERAEPSAHRRCPEGNLVAARRVADRRSGYVEILGGNVCGLPQSIHPHEYLSTATTFRYGRPVLD